MREDEGWIRRAESALQEAQALVDAGFPPASITRSYYAMFYGAKALLASKELSPKSHGGTLQKLGELFVRPGLLSAELSAAMGAAMELRQQADYTVSASALDEAKALEVLAAAGRFVEAARDLLKTS